MFIKPMLASPIERLLFTPGFAGNHAWVMEEKLDGHRLVVEVHAELASLLAPDVNRVTAWSRNGKPAFAAQGGLPAHMLDALGRLPVGIYDGELLVPGHRSYGVTELANSDRLVFVAFDLLEAEGVPTHSLALTERRLLLDLIFRHPRVEAVRGLRLAEQRPARTMKDVEAWRDEVWARDGEGLILKYRGATYRPGKRTPDWIKIKALRSAVLKVEGWQASRGKLNDRGPFAIVQLVDDEGHGVTVKVKDDETLKTVETEARSRKIPFVGRRLRIEFQERTPDGSYRHPRWDRWEDE